MSRFINEVSSLDLNEVEPVENNLRELYWNTTGGSTPPSLRGYHFLGKWRAENLQSLQDTRASISKLLRESVRPCDDDLIQVFRGELREIGSAIANLLEINEVQYEEVHAGDEAYCASHENLNRVNRAVTRFHHSACHSCFRLLREHQIEWSEPHAILNFGGIAIDTTDFPGHYRRCSSEAEVVRDSDSDL